MGAAERKGVGLNNTVRPLLVGCWVAAVPSVFGARQPSLQNGKLSSSAFSMPPLMRSMPDALPGADTAARSCVPG
jgi:hypothetical protein